MTGYTQDRSTDDSDFRTVAERVGARLDDLVAGMLERLWANPALEEWTRPETREPAAAIARASLGRELDALKRRKLPLSCPDEDLAAARAAVGYGAPVTVVLQCYRAGHAELWSAWLEEVERLGPRPDRRRALLEDGASFMFDYVDRCSAWVEREHTVARERALRGEEQRRTHLVRALLDGRDADPSPLGYELDAEHLAAVAWGREPDATLRALAAELDARLLTVSVDPHRAWGWLGRRADGGARWTAPERFRPPAGSRLALGDPARGRHGFRRSHHEALEAARVTERGDAPVTRYADIALEALVAGDEGRAAAFVDHELGPLATGGSRERKLRETLRAYFATGQNAASTAAVLGVHERTVSNRLRATEETLGRSVASRRAELETALRLRELLRR